LYTRRSVSFYRGECSPKGFFAQRAFTASRERLL